MPQHPRATGTPSGRVVHNPNFDRSIFGGGTGNLVTPQARAEGFGHDGRKGLRTSVVPGTQHVPVQRPWPGNGQGVAPAFPKLWDDGDGKHAYLKPHLGVAENNFSPISHRGVSNVGGELTFQGRGHAAASMQGAGLLDPVAAGRGYNQAQFNPSGAYHVVPANIPLVKQAKVQNFNRRGGTGYVVPNPQVSIVYPTYLRMNLPGQK